MSNNWHLTNQNQLCQAIQHDEQSFQIIPISIGKVKDKSWFCWRLLKIMNKNWTTFFFKYITSKICNRFGRWKFNSNSFELNRLNDASVIVITIRPKIDQTLSNTLIYSSNIFHNNTFNKIFSPISSYFRQL